jgi:hypothetical protein
MATWVCIQTCFHDPSGGSRAKRFRKGQTITLPEGVTPPVHCWAGAGEYKPAAPVVRHELGRKTQFPPSDVPVDEKKMADKRRTDAQDGKAKALNEGKEI